MGNRYLDWFRQAEADLRHARHALEDGDFEWSCFAAQQAAEKALKAVFQKLGMDAWGNTLTALIGNLPAANQLPPKLIDYAKMLDKHYIGLLKILFPLKAPKKKGCINSGKSVKREVLSDRPRKVTNCCIGSN